MSFRLKMSHTFKKKQILKLRQHVAGFVSRQLLFRCSSSSPEIPDLTNRSKVRKPSKKRFSMVSLLIIVNSVSLLKNS